MLDADTGLDTLMYTFQKSVKLLNFSSRWPGSSECAAIWWTLTHSVFSGNKIKARSYLNHFH